VNDEIDHGEKPESRRDDQDQRHPDHEMDRTMRQQWQRPSGLLVLAERHPDVCRTKSAMTCLKVRTSIHPISTPTGMDDDMEGNNKADALAALIGNGKNGKTRTIDLKASALDRTTQPVRIIYDISGDRLHLCGFGKKPVWPKGDRRLASDALHLSQGCRPAPARQSYSLRRIIQKQKLSFLCNICNIVVTVAPLSQRRSVQAYLTTALEFVSRARARIRRSCA